MFLLYQKLLDAQLFIIYYYPDTSIYESMYQNKCCVVQT